MARALTSAKRGRSVFFSLFKQDFHSFRSFRSFGANTFSRGCASSFPCTAKCDNCSVGPSRFRTSTAPEQCSPFPIRQERGGLCLPRRHLLSTEPRRKAWATDFTDFTDGIWILRQPVIRAIRGQLSSNWSSPVKPNQAKRCQLPNRLENRSKSSRIEPGQPGRTQSSSIQVQGSEPGGGAG